MKTSVKVALFITTLVPLVFNLFIMFYFSFFSPSRPSGGRMALYIISLVVLLILGESDYTLYAGTSNLNTIFRISTQVIDYKKETAELSAKFLNSDIGQPTKLLASNQQKYAIVYLEDSRFPELEQGYYSSIKLNTQYKLSFPLNWLVLRRIKMQVPKTVHNVYIGKYRER